MRLRRVFYPLHIRLARHGCANRPSYQIVVIPSTKSRDEPPIEQLGAFDPLPNSRGELVVSIDFKRMTHWLGEGARPTSPVARLLGLCGYFPLDPMVITNARRNNMKRKILAEMERKQKQEEEGTSVDGAETEASTWTEAKHES